MRLGGIASSRQGNGFESALVVAAELIELGLRGVRFLAEQGDELLRRPGRVLGEQLGCTAGGELLPA